MSDKITYDDKADLIVDTTIDDIFKVSASDMNEIKNVVNANAQEMDLNKAEVQDDIAVINNNITDLNNNKLDINEVLNQASTDTDKPYSANYLNDKLVSVGKTAPTDGRRVWFAKGKNLFNKDTITTGKYITDTGGEGTNSTTFCSGFIKVQPSTKYYVSGRKNGWGNVAFYDENKTFISRINETNNIFTTTSTTYYIRINGNLNDLDTLQIEPGLQPTSYEPYIEPSINVDGEKMYYDNYSTNEKVIGKWIDGRNLYRKVITITSINTNANATDVSISLANLNEIVNIGGSVRTNSGQYKPVASIYIDGKGVQSIYIFSVYTVSSTTLTVSYGDWWKNVFGKANIIIEYTKTID